MAKKISLEQKQAIKTQNARRKKDKKQQEIDLLNRCLSLFVIFAIAEIYFLVCYRFFVAEATFQSIVTISNVMMGTAIGGGIAAAVGIVLALVRRHRKGGRIGQALAILGVVLLAGYFVTMAVYPGGAMAMCVAAPLLAVAGFVYYLYQKEFFVAGVGLGLSVLGLWMAHRAMSSAAWGSRYLIVEGVLLAVVILALICAVVIGKNGGKIGRGEKEKQFFTPGGNYKVLYATLVVAALGLILAMCAAGAAFYLLWIGVALIFVLAVYYTIHLM